LDITEYVIMPDGVSLVSFLLIGLLELFGRMDHAKVYFCRLNKW